MFNSPFGLSTSFDLYKQDSTYININLPVGAQYTLSANQNGSVFLQLASSNLLNVDTPGDHRHPYPAAGGRYQFGQPGRDL